MGYTMLKLRTLLALVLLVVLAVVCVFLGRWQLSRAAERVAIAQAITEQSQASPLHLAASTPAQEMREWRPASATGGQVQWGCLALFGNGLGNSNALGGTA